jgi:predicted Fe-Mo cluster-binding NifX family protein
MKVAVASDDKETISHHFGRALGFVVFPVSGGKRGPSEYRENIGKSTGECGSCDHGRMIENIKDCDVVISYGMGRRIYHDLTANKIRAVVTDKENVREAMDSFLRNELENRTDKLH